MEHEIWKTFGHRSIKEILSLQISQNRLAHAYLFWGQESLGKQTLALEVAGKILKTNNPFTHPDFIFLTENDEGKIEIEALRQFMQKIGFKPFVGGFKVAILNSAHLLSVQSANALLKTLEEPAGNTVIFLISSSGQMLPTIVSRCQSFYFNQFSETAILEFARSKDIEVSSELLTLSFGRPGFLIALAGNKKKSEYITALKEQVQNLKNLTVPERLLLISKYADMETLELQNILQIWLNVQVQQLKKNIKDFKMVEKLSVALAGLKQNLNKKLILQNLFLNI